MPPSPLRRAAGRARSYLSDHWFDVALLLGLVFSQAAGIAFHEVPTWTSVIATIVLIVAWLAVRAWRASGSAHLAEKLFLPVSFEEGSASDLEAVLRADEASPQHVGLAAEPSVVEEAVGFIQESRAKTLRITGERGQGKSMLAYQIARACQARTRGMRIWECSPDRLNAVLDQSVGVRDIVGAVDALRGKNKKKFIIFDDSHEINDGYGERLLRQMSAEPVAGVLWIETLDSSARRSRDSSSAGPERDERANDPIDREGGMLRWEFRHWCDDLRDFYEEKWPEALKRVPPDTEMINPCHLNYFATGRAREEAESVRQLRRGECLALFIVCSAYLVLQRPVLQTEVERWMARIKTKVAGLDEWLRDSSEHVRTVELLNCLAGAHHGGRFLITKESTYAPVGEWPRAQVYLGALLEIPDGKVSSEQLVEALEILLVEEWEEAPFVARLRDAFVRYDASCRNEDGSYHPIESPRSGCVLCLLDGELQEIYAREIAREVRVSVDGFTPEVVELLESLSARDDLLGRVFTTGDVASVVGDGIAGGGTGPFLGRTLNVLAASEAVGSDVMDGVEWSRLASPPASGTGTPLEMAEFCEVLIHDLREEWREHVDVSRWAEWIRSLNVDDWLGLHALLAELGEKKGNLLLEKIGVEEVQKYASGLGPNALAVTADTLSEEGEVDRLIALLGVDATAEVIRKARPEEVGQIGRFLRAAGRNRGALVEALDLRDLGSTTSGVPSRLYSSLAFVLELLGDRQEEMLRHVKPRRLAGSMAGSPAELGSVKALMEQLGRRRVEFAKGLTKRKWATLLSSAGPGELKVAARIAEMLGPIQSEVVDEMDVEKLGASAKNVRAGEITGIQAMLRVLGKRADDFLDAILGPEGLTLGETFKQLDASDPWVVARLLGVGQPVDELVECLEERIDVDSLLESDPSADALLMLAARMTPKGRSEFLGKVDDLDKVLEDGEGYIPLEDLSLVLETVEELSGRDTITSLLRREALRGRLRRRYREAALDPTISQQAYGCAGRLLRVAMSADPETGRCIARETADELARTARVTVRNCQALRDLVATYEEASPGSTRPLLDNKSFGTDLTASADAWKSFATSEVSDAFEDLLDKIQIQSSVEAGSGAGRRTTSVQPATSRGTRAERLRLRSEHVSRRGVVTDVRPFGAVVLVPGEGSLLLHRLNIHPYPVNDARGVVLPNTIVDLVIRGVSPRGPFDRHVLVEAQQVPDLRDQLEELMEGRDEVVGTVLDVTDQVVVVRVQGPILGLVTKSSLDGQVEPGTRILIQSDEVVLVPETSDEARIELPVKGAVREVDREWLYLDVQGKIGVRIPRQSIGSVGILDATAHFQPSQEVPFRVDIDNRSDGRQAVSIRVVADPGRSMLGEAEAMTADRTEQARLVYPEGSSCPGRVNNVDWRGVFVELPGGFRGLLHKSEIGERLVPGVHQDRKEREKGVLDPTEYFEIGDAITVHVLEILDGSREPRLRFTMPDAPVPSLDQQLERICRRYPKGTELRGLIVEFKPSQIYVTSRGLRMLVKASDVGPDGALEPCKWYGVGDRVRVCVEKIELADPRSSPDDLRVSAAMPAPDVDLPPHDEQFKDLKDKFDGLELQGEIEGIAEFSGGYGVFVSLSDCLSGMIKIPWAQKDILQELRIAECVRVRVTDVRDDPERPKIALELVES